MAVGPLSARPQQSSGEGFWVVLSDSVGTCAAPVGTPPPVSAMRFSRRAPRPTHGAKACSQTCWRPGACGRCRPPPPRHSDGAGAGLLCPPPTAADAPRIWSACSASAVGSALRVPVGLGPSAACQEPLAPLDSGLPKLLVMLQGAPRLPGARMRPRRLGTGEAPRAGRGAGLRSWGVVSARGRCGPRGREPESARRGSPRAARPQ